MSSSAAERITSTDHPTADGPLPAVVDWLLGALVALGGVLSFLVGTVLALVVDREMLVAGVEDGTITVTTGTVELTDPEVVEVTRAVVSWTAVGLLMTGLGTVLFAGWYVLGRSRARRNSRPDDPPGTYIQSVVLGAAATVLLSFLPFSPALGGVLAGYLEHSESGRTISVGALAGLLPMLPVLVLLAFVLGGTVVGLLAVEQAGAALLVGVATFLVVLLVATFGAGLGALGGYAGGRFADSRTAGP